MDARPLTPALCLALVFATGLPGGGASAHVSAIISSSAATVGDRHEIIYDVRVVAPEHHWMEIDITYGDLPDGPLELRMSRSSPGRYALHEFAKNVFDVRAVGADGTPLRIDRPDPYGWTVPEHDGAVVVTYRIYGDRADGTYLQVDTSHAHMNGPATFLWARGLDTRPIRVRLHAPADESWTVATQLFPTDSANELTAPNLRYLLDSPIEFGETEIHAFEVTDANGTQTIRVALHTLASEQARADYLAAVRATVEEMVEVFGEYPRFDGGTYTFIADYLPWASGDGMEHRNSTILSAPVTLDQAGRNLLGTVSHEFFHAWNVERIRPASLEPFDFEAANMSSELWLAEGFTSYYGNLVLHRADVTALSQLLGTLAGYVSAVRTSPGVRFRSAVEMSRLAPFVDAARPVDRTYWENTFLSYYTYGAALGLRLDLMLRDHSDGAVTLDDYMRALWERHGAIDGAEPPAVPRPYDLADARAVLADVAGDAEFADVFFDRHVEGTETIDYAPLLERAGIALEPLGPGIAYFGVAVEPGQGGLVITEATEIGTPAYEAGLDRDDVLLAIDGRRMSTFEDIPALLRAHAPGDRVSVRVRRRDGSEATVPVTFGSSAMVRLTPVEETGRTPTPEQLAFRAAWLESRRERVGALPSE